MKKLLYITANPKLAQNSFSLSIGQKFLEIYNQSNPNDEITHLDLYKTNIPFIDTDALAGWDKLKAGITLAELTPSEKNSVEEINKLTDQFIIADKYIFVTPMWNLSIPAKMKAYLDTICIVGKTFKYTENGPVGFLKDKKAVHIQARGGIYSKGEAKDFEFGDRYIQAVLTFLGVPSIDSIIAEGMSENPSKAQEIKEKALNEAEELAKRF